MEKMLPARLAEIVEDFAFCEGREKLEYLLEFAERLPALPEELAGVKDENYQVHECITPIFIYTQVDAGKLYYHFDVPAESPTVRGYASLMQEGTNGITPQEILAIPNEFYLEMGLQQVLSGQRLNGLNGILRHMKRLAQATLPANSD